MAEPDAPALDPCASPPATWADLRRLLGYARPYRGRLALATASLLLGGAKPKAIFITPDLPKTRSGKIMRRLLRDVAEGRNLGDTTTLADASVVDELQQRAADGDGDG